MAKDKKAQIIIRPVDNGYILLTEVGTPEAGESVYYDIQGLIDGLKDYLTYREISHGNVD